MSNPRAVHISGPLAMYVEGFCEELVGQGYVLEATCVQVRLVHLSSGLESAGLEGCDLTPVRLEDFLLVRRAAGCRELVSSRGLVPFLTYLTGLGVVAPPPAAMPTANDLVVSDYRRHLVIHRGLAPSTVDHYIDVAQKVLAQWGDQVLELAAVTAGEVTAFVVGASRRCNVPTAKALVTACDPGCATWPPRDLQRRIWLARSQRSPAGEGDGSLEASATPRWRPCWPASTRRRRSGFEIGRC
jgi:hypothetical protein